MKLGERQQDGATLLQHATVIAERTGAFPAEYRVDVPAAAGTLWSAFIDLMDARAPGLDGPGAIAPSEIAAWQSNMGIRLTQWEVETLSLLDRVVREAMRARTAGAKQQQQ